ncbi:hypothetical protein ACHAXA_008693 [Cyclostephanos tholiformis]|uniref:Pre-mRNA-splicing factor Syf1/CRNKL1-like C-terminal HAT-repeats domain-containing protein n=1 Tax=Cyclostephanos tholiformis TaxID=382380 RepID=A0ABD3R2P9_9STRA
MRTKSLEITNEPPSIWSFDSLFAAPVLDERSVLEDLYGIREREAREREVRLRRQSRGALSVSAGGGGGGGREDVMEEANEDREGGRPHRPADDLELTRRAIMEHVNVRDASSTTSSSGIPIVDDEDNIVNDDGGNVDVTAQSTVTLSRSVEGPSSSSFSSSFYSQTSSQQRQQQQQQQQQSPPPVDKALTRMVQDRMYGLTRTPDGTIQYSTSMLDTSRAVQFREGVRLGRALSINIDRLCYFAKKDMSHGRLEEAQEYYAKAKNMDPMDGRPYLGLSRIAHRRGDLVRARELLREGIAKSSGGYVVVRGPSKVAVVEGGRRTRVNRRSEGESFNDDDIVDGDKSDVGFEKEEGSVIGTIPDLGPNPFLLQALGTLEQELGNLAAAEELYLQAIRSRPSHAAAWVALAQLRTKELRQDAASVSVCYQSAERELRRIGARPNAYVYTAWASMEHKKGSREDDAKSSHRARERARELYRKALAVDPRCSAAYLQLGVMESECGNFEAAESCFEEVLKFDQRNSRVLQAYAIMESRRTPREVVDSRRVLDLFERALKANHRDAGVYQAYALYVAELGDVDSARNLLQKGTEVNKRHAPVWQAWGVLETRYNSAKAARDVFQQGIWSCAQPGQSGGRRCARLWQAWGVLESQEGDHAAARRCFSRALDADKRNVAAVTAWALMEAELGNFADARSIFERSLKLFRSPSVDKMAIWRAYEIMEERYGHTREAQLVFQRSMRESISSSNVEEDDLITGLSLGGLAKESNSLDAGARTKSSKRGREMEVERWDTGSNELDSEVWMNNGSIEVNQGFG